MVCHQTVEQQLTFKWLFSFGQMQEKDICEECWQKFIPIQANERCSGCGRKQAKNSLCYDCSRWQKNGQTVLLKNRALFVYNEAMQHFMEEYKFKGDYYWRYLFQDIFEQNLHYYYRKDWIYVPIPVDEQTMSVRGFNQVIGLLRTPATTVAALKMKHFTKRTKQSHKNRAQRLATKQPFEYVENKSITGKKILLLDDVYTTGRTLYYAQELLLQAGAECVQSFTLAR
ncbi:phosphoribosyltransferase [Liquorilactobacillus capillatus DSM 19910]|uniref:Phosphoribosyltransferase n=1 Tax=Liquorilactobacillus capillatus DSM 19910 TaxID=1423731 RepID=A0A0R1M4B1_9LACO|nr:phosphoribosyltransferase [Liquorilactobacillus capillatus DSM 19910]